MRCDIKDCPGRSGRTYDDLRWDIVWLRNILDDIQKRVDSDDVDLHDIYHAMDKYRNEDNEKTGRIAEIARMR